MCVPPVFCEEQEFPSAQAARAHKARVDIIDAEYEVVEDSKQLSLDL